jgi:hypothetical protein
MRAPVLLVALVAAFAAACVRTPDPMIFVEEAVSVHALLRVSDTEPRVWLHWMTPQGAVGVSGSVA